MNSVLSQNTKQVEAYKNAKYHLRPMSGLNENCVSLIARDRYVNEVKKTKEC
jgi:hypothetical protein